MQPSKSALALLFLPLLSTADCAQSGCPVVSIIPRPTNVRCGGSFVPAGDSASRFAMTPASDVNDLACATRCFNAFGCMSFNYNASSKNCAMYSRTGGKMGLVPGAAKGGFWHRDCFVKPASCSTTSSTSTSTSTSTTSSSSSTSTISTTSSTSTSTTSTSSTSTTTTTTSSAPAATATNIQLIVSAVGTPHDGSYIYADKDTLANPARFISSPAGTSATDASVFSLATDGTLSSGLIGVSAQQAHDMTAAPEDQYAYTLYFPTSPDVTADFPIYPVTCTMDAITSFLSCASQVGNTFFTCDSGSNDDGTYMSGLAIGPAGGSSDGLLEACSAVQIKAVVV